MQRLDTGLLVRKTGTDRLVITSLRPSPLLDHRQPITSRSLRPSWTTDRLSLHVHFAYRRFWTTDHLAITSRSLHPSPFLYLLQKLNYFSVDQKILTLFFYRECSVILFHLLVSQLGSEEQEQPAKNCDDDELMLNVL